MFEVEKAKTKRGKEKQKVERAKVNRAKQFSFKRRRNRRKKTQNAKLVNINTNTVPKESEDHVTKRKKKMSSYKLKYDRYQLLKMAYIKENQSVTVGLPQPRRAAPRMRRS